MLWPQAARPSDSAAASSAVGGRRRMVDMTVSVLARPVRAMRQQRDGGEDGSQLSRVTNCCGEAPASRIRRKSLTLKDSS
jgi:hypothetical protein